MQITKLNADKNYKQTYFNIDGNIYNIKNALSHFLEHKEAIIKEKRQLKPAKIDLVFNVLPSDETIIKKIKEKRSKIFKELKITNNNNPKNIQKLALYLIKNVQYYEPIKEEVVSIYNFEYQTQLEKVQKRLETATTRLDEINKEYKVSKNNIALLNKKKMYERLVDKCFDDYYVYYDKHQTQLQISQDKYVLQSIYKTIIENKGVCSELSYTFAYLLNGIGVKNEVLHISYVNKDSIAHHALNTFKTKNDKYYFCDILEGYFTAHYLKKDITTKNSDKAKRIIEDTFFEKEHYQKIFKKSYIRYFDNIVEKPDFSVKMNTRKIAIKELEEKIANTVQNSTLGKK